MSFTADINLPFPYIVVSASATAQGIKCGAGYKFGIVEKIYMGCYSFLTSQNIAYNSANAVAINYQNKEYWIVRENDIIFSEAAPLILG